MKASVSFISAILLGVVSAAAEDHMIGHWDFADAKEASVPGKVGPAGKIIRYGTCSEIVQRAGKTMLKITRDTKKPNTTGGFIIHNLPLNPTTPFTIICNLYFDDELPPSGRNEFFAISDGDKRQGFRVFYFWGSIIMRTGDGQNLQQLSSRKHTRDFRLPAGRIIQFATTYDGTTATLYADGKKIAEDVFAIQPCKNRNLEFGSIGAGFGYPLNGALGNLRVYDKALSAQEIAEKFLAEQANQE